MAKFTKPTLEEIRAYAAEVFPQLDAGRFYDYYESCGWTVGRNKPMKNWQAAIRTWKRSHEERYGKPETRDDWRNKYESFKQPT